MEQTYRKPVNQEIFDKYITKEQYGDFKYILDEILHRRAYEFRFDPDRMEEEAQNLANNVKAIEFMTDEEHAKLDSPDTLAIFKGEEKKIKINATFYKKLEEVYNKYYPPQTAKYLLGKDMYSILTHEIYHGINYREDDGLGLVERDKMTGIITGGYLNEIVTESAATRTVKNKDNVTYQNGYMGTIGYQTTTCFTSLLANAIGVSERDLLAHALYDRAEFEGFFHRANEHSFSHEESEEHFKNILYMTSLLSHPSIGVQSQNAPIAFEHMYNTLFELAAEHMRLDDRPLSEELIGEHQFRGQRMMAIADSSLDYLVRENYVTEEERNAIYEKAGVPHYIRNIMIGSALSFARMKGIDSESIEDLDFMLANDMRKNMPKYQVGMMNVIADDYTQKAKWDEGAYLYVAKVLDKEYLRHIAPEKTEEKIGIFDPSKIKVENIGVGNILINGDQSQNKGQTGTGRDDDDSDDAR